VVSRLRSFCSLRHLILYLTIFDLPRHTIDILDLGYLLEAAPSMEKLELHVSFFLFISSLICRCELIGSICMYLACSV
jgi:hypothetical protein